MDLFRAEAVDSNTRFAGDVSIAPPPSWQLIGYFLGVTLLVLMLFLALGSYGQSVTVSGQVAAEKGVVRIAAPRDAVLARLMVREGQDVRPGQALALLERATHAPAGVLEDQRAAALAAQRAALAGRLPLLQADSKAELGERQIEIATQRLALASIDRQMDEQRALVAAAIEGLARVRAIAERGFVSRNELRTREETLALRRQGLSQMQRDRGEAASRKALAEAEVRRYGTTLAVDRLAVAREQGAVAAQAADDSAQRFIRLTAPAGGIVTGVSVSPGASVSTATTILSIVPRTTPLIARIMIPSSGVGFVEPGQTVAVAVDAFPREIYGTLPARIASVSRASVPVTTGGATADMFVATATLDRPYVKAYGEARPLRPGMSIRATITTRRQSLLRWLLAPIYAVGGG